MFPASASAGHDRGEPHRTKWLEPGFLVILIFFIFLAAAAVSLDVLQTTYGLKSDEATYVSMSLSLAHDGDIAFDRQDLTRFWQIYGTGPNGIFLKRGREIDLTIGSRVPFVGIERPVAATDDRLYYGKAFIYPLVAAPFVRIGGLNGLLLLNVLLLAGVFCCTYAFAAERLPAAGALLVASGFLGASAAPLYAVWLMPETFNMSLVCYAYFLWLFKEVRPSLAADRSFLTDRSSDLGAAALLGLVAFSKPSNLPLILPLMALPVWRRQIRQGLLIGVIFAAVVGAGFGITALTSGEFNYQGGDRKTFYGHYPFEDGQANFDVLGTRMTTDALPADAGRPSFLGQLGHNTVYFFAGRHFGLIPYFMPGIVILGWALWRRRTLAVWHLLIGITVAATAAGLLVLLPNTWSGGGGPVGNRYFLSFYPALFFLLPAGRSALPGIIMWVAGALFTAQILVDPFVAAKRTWQHAEQGLFRLLPVELTMVNDLPVRLDQGRSRIPYGSDPTLLLSYLDRNAWRPDASGIWIAGAARGEIVVRVNPPLSELAVTLRSPIPNTVTVTVDGSRHRAEVQPDTPVSIRIPVQGVYAAGAQNFLLRVETDRGFVPQLTDGRSRDQRYLGVSLELVGLTRPTTASQ